MTDQDSVAPWYKQPWLWFILAPLIATLLYSTVYITASIVTHDGVVLEEYTKKAKAFHENNELRENARSMGLFGDLRMDQLTGDIVVKLQGDGDVQLPAELELIIGHPTKASLDIMVQLRELQQGNYVGSVEKNLLGRKFLIIQPADKTWQLGLEVEPPYDEQTFKLGVQ
ncbi:FixH family protein [Amphritea balenae]|uniref:Nitrogen fixation protein FixH n=1 Tax=Amphritea balenae TaxID=452629 RepID=A0A3P1SKJ4_9GAMM|nr:FixH family protein [Amphritea balenae]RRC97803.1 hypothetical protein EHS89_16650 [Amphritea balenae]